MNSQILQIGPRITCLPVIHGSGDFALAVRRLMLERSFDCVAVPLPRVVPGGCGAGDRASADADDCDAGGAAAVYDRVVAGRMTRIRDLDQQDERRGGRTDAQLCADRSLPAGDRGAAGGDERAHSAGVHRPGNGPLRAELGGAAGCVCPEAASRPSDSRRRCCRRSRGRRVSRCRTASSTWPAACGELETKHSSILFVCSILDWPWIREAYVEQTPVHSRGRPGRGDHALPARRANAAVPAGRAAVHHRTVRAGAGRAGGRRESVDRRRQGAAHRGSRRRYKDDLKRRARKITPHLAAAVPEVHSQSVAVRAAVHARSLHARDRRQADGRRSVRAARGRDGPRVSAATKPAACAPVTLGIDRAPLAGRRDRRA